LNLQNKKKKNFFFLSTGMFIKFFNKKKNLKKNKITKILMAKFLRKINLLIKFKFILIIVKKIPLNLMEFLTFLNSQIIHKFQNPYGDNLIEEKINDSPLFRIINFIFTKNIDFSNNKKKKKGRIKRKIIRKLTILNKLID
jgi:hypothetical protein